MRIGIEIDFVIAWVDGADPAWQAERHRFSADSWDAGGAHRYRDHGLLPYWFRAVEAYAPWVRKIHFVTWGHVPPFLNRNAPKIHIVRHEDFIPAQYLPTFNSHTIEANLHRIPGLSEHFVYFNDDMFLLRPVDPEDFFREGLPCTCGCEVPWAFSGEVGIWAHAAANGLGLVNRHFFKKEVLRKNGKRFLAARRWQDRVRTLGMELLFPDYFTGFRNLHGPSAFRKQTFREVWEAEPKLLMQTCAHRFRSAEDVNQWAFLWWQVAGGCFCHRDAEGFAQGVSGTSIGKLCRTVEQQRYEFLCIQDAGGDVAEALARLGRSFQTILPEKSEYEA